MNNPMSNDIEKVKVIVRCRPMSSVEIEKGYESIVQAHLDKREIEVRKSTTTDSSSNCTLFSYDSVYDSRVSQKELYENSFRPLVQSVLEGYNGTIFAYGQTATGKTFTMEGNMTNEEEYGIIPNAFKHIFSHVQENHSKQYLIRASYLEIYQEEISDLLTRTTHLKLKECPETGVYVKDLTAYLCSNYKEILNLVRKGNKFRSVNSTNMNERSSRSHAILQITIEVGEIGADGETHFRVGKLNLVDLAGSERQSKTGAIGQRLKESTKINLSLSALGNVIAALADNAKYSVEEKLPKHIPYRNSKLTRLLQDSLGGNSRTLMVATIGPANYNLNETLNTLRYASRAKSIQNKPKINENPKDALLRQYQEEIIRLRAELAKKKSESQQEIEELEIESKEFSVGDNLKMDVRPVEKEEISETKTDDSVDSSTNSNDEEVDIIPSETIEQVGEIAQICALEKEQECQLLTRKIDWIESKVLGGDKFLDEMSEHQKLIELHEEELVEQDKKLDEMLRELEERESNTAQTKKHLNSAETEFLNKSRKLKKLNHKLTKANQLIENVQIDNDTKRQGLESILSQLRQELKLKQLIVENFIPPESQEAAENLILWNKELKGYGMKTTNQLIIKRPRINRLCALPLYNKSANDTVDSLANVHYTNQNILQLHPIERMSYSKDYLTTVDDVYLRKMMQLTLEEIENEVVIDCCNLSPKNILNSMAKDDLHCKCAISSAFTKSKPLTFRKCT